MLRSVMMLGVLAAGVEAADDHPDVDPHEAQPGQVCEWHAADGLKYEYYVPAGYDRERGANLTLVLHGNGLDHRWTFLNHPAGEFRPDDIVVSPDGTTFTQGTNANEFLGEAKDAARLHALIGELKECWKTNQLFLYGHSQGSFFVFYYAGQYPAEVDGVVGHSSGVWNWSTLSSKGHRQAIGLMHGTADGNVPYGQSWWGRKVYRERGYPLVHLRTLFDWGHQPSWGQAQLQLAWCEGMTSEDIARVEVCLTTLAQPDVPLGRDWSALWAVANRLANDKRATEAQRARAADLAAKVDGLAARHVAAIEASLGKAGVNQLKTVLAGEATPLYVGHVPRLIEDFDGVPAAEVWHQAAARVLDKLVESAEESYGDYLRESKESKEKAFKLGMKLLDEGWMHSSVPGVAKQLERWVQDPQLDVSKKDAERLQALLAAWREGRKAGFAEASQLDAEAEPLESR